MGYKYNKLFWGLIFITLNFNFSFNGPTIDLIPNFVGYFMIASFFNNIPIEENISKIPLNFAVVLGIIDILKIFFNYQSTNSIMVITSMAWGIILLAMQLVIYYSICKIIIDQATENNDSELISLGHRVWKIVFSYNIILMIYIPCLVNFGESIGYINVAMIVMGFIQIINLLILIRKAHNKFEEGL